MVKKQEEIVFGRKRYSSIKELCDEHGVNYCTFYYRKNKGWTMKECLFGKKSLSIKSFGIKFEGIRYSSYSELCKKYNVNYTTFMARRKKGWDIEECVFGKRDRKIKDTSASEKIEKKKPLNYQEKVYSSYQEWCEENDVDYELFKKRMNMGWYIDDCIYGRSSDDERAGVEYQGIVYSSFNNLCKKYGRNPREVYDKMNVLGWSLGKALQHEYELEEIKGYALWVI